MPQPSSQPSTPLPLGRRNDMDKSLVRPPPKPPPPCSRVRFPTTRHPRVKSPPPTPLVSYNIPLEKGKAILADDVEYNIPPGSIADPTILVRPASPTTPCEFPFLWEENLASADDSIAFGKPSPPHRHETIRRVVGLMRMCGLNDGMDGGANIARTTASATRQQNTSLLNGGANICLTGVLDLLLDVETIAPVPISVATKGDSISANDCCTKKGLLPLTLDDGSIYYQPCFYCKNAVETIVSPQAILAESDVLVRWTQTGHRDRSPGKVRFESDSGLLTFTITLENKDGLYYCPSDMFTIEEDTHCASPRIVYRTSIEPLPIKR